MSKRINFNPLSGKFDYTESPTSGYGLADDPDYLTDPDYVYVGYEHITDGSWYIYRRTRATNLRQCASGVSSYSTNWTGRSGLTYV